MRNLTFFALQFCSVVALAAPGKSAGPEADEIVRRADAARIPDGSVTFMVSAKDYEKKEFVRETRYKVFNKGREKSLVQTEFPVRQKGRKLLMEEDNLWFYTPDTRKPARVSMQQKLTGEISNGDLARTNFAGDYDAKIDGSEKIGGKETYRLTLTANRKGVTYSKIDYWVDKASFAPVKAVFYALSGKVLKTAQYSGLKDVLDSKCVTKLLFTDALDPSKQSIVVYSDHARTPIPDSVFSKESLRE